MLILKIAVVSCALYLGFAIAAQLAFYALMLWKDGVFISFTRWGWTILSGAVWLISTSVAFRIVATGIHAKLSGR
jgi:hypothetical protein